MVHFNEIDRGIWEIFLPFRYSLKWNQTCKGGHSSDVPLHSVQWINMLMSYAFALTILLIVVCYPSIFNVPSILILVIIHRPHRKQLAIQLLNPMIMQWVTINKRKRMVEPRTWHQRHNSTTTTTRHGVSKGLENQPPKEPMGRTGGGGSQPTDVSTEYDIDSLHTAWSFHNGLKIGGRAADPPRLEWIGHQWPTHRLSPD